MPVLLSRDVFRERVLSRANGICCVPGCKEKAVDAHHIMNRNLFAGDDENGGYFYENGAQLCSEHHYDTELTCISVEDIREWCNVTAVVPEGWDDSGVYDCWGNRIVENGFREPGPLFEDSGFQKILTKERLGWLFQASL